MSASAAAAPTPAATPVGHAPVVSLCFNATQTQAALALNTHLLYIVDCGSASGLWAPSAWRVAHVLRRHHGHIAAVVWHPTTNAILSCGHDREAYVWVQSTSTKSTGGTGSPGVAAPPSTREWEPQLVVLDAGVSRGLTSAAWSPCGRKLYLGSAAAVLVVGCYDEEHRWWVCRLLRDVHGSTVTALAPHPVEATLLASGGLDGALVLSSTWMKKADGKRTGAAPFGTVYMKRRGLDALGKRGRAWVHAVAWTASGEHLAIATHDSRLHILFAGREVTAGLIQGTSPLLSDSGGGGGAAVMHTISLASLPLLRLAFIQGDDDALVGVGHAPFPMLFRRSDADATTGAVGVWALEAVGVEPRVRSGSTAVHVDPTENELVRGGRGRLAEVLATSTCGHAGSITCVAGASDGASFVTAGVDGRIIQWPIHSLVSL